MGGAEGGGVWLGLCSTLFLGLPMAQGGDGTLKERSPHLRFTARWVDAVFAAANGDSSSPSQTKSPRPRGRPTFLCSRLVTMEAPKRTPKGTSALCRPVDMFHPDFGDASPELQWVGNEAAPFGCFFDLKVSTKNMPDYKSKLS